MAESVLPVGEARSHAAVVADACSLRVSPSSSYSYYASEVFEQGLTDIVSEKDSALDKKMSAGIGSLSGAWRTPEGGDGLLGALVHDAAPPATANVALDIPLLPEVPDDMLGDVKMLESMLKIHFSRLTTIAQSDSRSSEQHGPPARAMLRQGAVPLSRSLGVGGTGCGDACAPRALAGPARGPPGAAGGECSISQAHREQIETSTDIDWVALCMHEADLQRRGVRKDSVAASRARRRLRWEDTASQALRALVRVAEVEAQHNKDTPALHRTATASFLLVLAGVPSRWFSLEHGTFVAPREAHGAERSVLRELCAAGDVARRVADMASSLSSSGSAASQALGSWTMRYMDAYLGRILQLGDITLHEGAGAASALDTLASTERLREELLDIEMLCRSALGTNAGDAAFAMVGDLEGDTRSADVAASVARAVFAPLAAKLEDAFADGLRAAPFESTELQEVLPGFLAPLRPIAAECQANVRLLDAVGADGARRAIGDPPALILALDESECSVADTSALQWATRAASSLIREWRSFEARAVSGDLSNARDRRAHGASSLTEPSGQPVGDTASLERQRIAAAASRADEALARATDSAAERAEHHQGARSSILPALPFASLLPDAARAQRLAQAARAMRDAFEARMRSLALRGGEEVPPEHSVAARRAQVALDAFIAAAEEQAAVHDEQDTEHKGSLASDAEVQSADAGEEAPGALVDGDDAPGGESRLASDPRDRSGASSRVEADVVTGGSSDAGGTMQPTPASSAASPEDPCELRAPEISSMISSLELSAQQAVRRVSSSHCCAGAPSELAALAALGKSLGSLRTLSRLACYFSLMIEHDMLGALDVVHDVVLLGRGDFAHALATRVGDAVPELALDAALDECSCDGQWRVVAMEGVSLRARRCEDSGSFRIHVTLPAAARNLLSEAIMERLEAVGSARLALRRAAMAASSCDSSWRGAHRLRHVFAVVERYVLLQLFDVEWQSLRRDVVDAKREWSLDKLRARIEAFARAAEDALLLSRRTQALGKLLRIMSDAAMEANGLLSHGVAADGKAAALVQVERAFDDALQRFVSALGSIVRSQSVESRLYHLLVELDFNGGLFA